MEIKKKLIESHKGKIIPPEIRAKISEALKGDKHPRWKGGRLRKPEGYIIVRLYPDDFFYPMADHQGYVYEHRLVVAKALNRCLLSWEVVHHKNGIKDDNRYPENLLLLPLSKYHLIDTIARRLIRDLQKRVTQLEAENVLLRQQILERRLPSKW